MKRIILTFTFAILTQISYGQINTTKVAESKNKVTKETYDSTQNFVGLDAYKYIGQDLYLKGVHKDLRKYGYRNFLLNYKSTGSKEENTYKCCDGHNSKYEELAGKYFKVVAVHKHPKANISTYFAKKFYLELKEKESGDKVYFEYSGRYKHEFPFIVVGFFEKIKRIVVGQKYVFANKVFSTKTDINTGDSITNTPNQLWECTDLTIEEKHYNLSLVVKNQHNQSTTISYNALSLEHRRGKPYTENEAKDYEEKFGMKDWLTILDGKVIIGFTEEMTILSWGKPKRINYTSYRDQWVYDGQYLYFKNGILKSFN